MNLKKKKRNKLEKGLVCVEVWILQWDLHQYKRPYGAWKKLCFWHFWCVMFSNQIIPCCSKWMKFYRFPLSPKLFLMPSSCCDSYTIRPPVVCGFLCAGAATSKRSIALIVLENQFYSLYKRKHFKTEMACRYFYPCYELYFIIIQFFSIETH